jgi:hypothetical protein
MKHYLYLTLAILLLAGCSQKPQSDVDTPEYHFKAGMRAVETGEYNAALTSFQRFRRSRPEICSRLLRTGTRPCPPWKRQRS